MKSKVYAQITQISADFYLITCVICVICGSLFLLTSGSAYAHAQLLRASPAPGDKLADSPAEVRLIFNEPLWVGSRITLYGRNFTPTIELDPEVDGAELFAAAPPLAPGEYTVQWTAVSQDGHPVTGSYAFVLLEPERHISPLWLLLFLPLIPAALYLRQKGRRRV